MDDPNITMEEYIRLEEKKAQKRKKVFNWEIGKYGKIWYDEDIHDLRSVETEFPAIAFNDEVSSEKTLSCEPTVSSLNDENDFRLSFDDSDDEDYTFGIPFDPKRYYKDDVYTRMLWRPRAIRHIHSHGYGELAKFYPNLKPQYDVFDFGGLPDLMAEGLSARMLMEHMDAQGAWVAMGPERQPDVAAGAPGVAQDAPAVDEGVQAVLVPVQAPQQPPPPPPPQLLPGLCHIQWTD
ncbi:hypothetical protein Tco_0024536 [Tanacetum coccineum]